MAGGRDWPQVDTAKGLLAVAILALFYALLVFSLQSAASAAAINLHSSSTLGLLTAAAALDDGRR